MAKLDYDEKSVSNPRWGNAEHTMIDVDLVFPHIGPDPVHFTAARVDKGWEHGEEIFLRCLKGDFGPIGKYVKAV